MSEPFDEEVISLRHVEAMQKRDRTTIAVRFGSGMSRIYDFKDEELADDLMEIYFKEYATFYVSRSDLKDGTK